MPQAERICYNCEFQEVLTSMCFANTLQASSQVTFHPLVLPQHRVLMVWTTVVVVLLEALTMVGKYNDSSTRTIHEHLVHSRRTIPDSLGRSHHMSNMMRAVSSKHR